MEREQKVWLKGESFYLTADEIQEMNDVAAEGKLRESEDTAYKHVTQTLKKESVEATAKKKAAARATRLKKLGGVAMMALGLVLDYLFPSDGVMLAQIIGPLITGAGVVTTFAGRAQCDEYIILGDPDTAMPLRGLSVEIDGKSRFNVQGSQPLMSAIAKWLSQVTGAVVGVVLKISTGNIQQTTTYRFTNDGATTPNILTSSDAANGVAIEAATVGINALSYEDFDKFSALFITPSANVASVDITYEDGHRESGLNVIDLDGQLALNNQTEANGRLDAVVTTIDNRPILGRPIRSVRINATTAVTVAVVKLNDVDYQTLKA